MELKVGSYYWTRDGKRVRIVGRLAPHLISDGGALYTPSGKRVGYQEHIDDIVGEASE